MTPEVSALNILSALNAGRFTDFDHPAYYNMPWLTLLLAIEERLGQDWAGIVGLCLVPAAVHAGTRSDTRGFVREMPAATVSVMSTNSGQSLNGP